MFAHNFQIGKIENHLENTLPGISVTSFLKRFHRSRKMSLSVRQQPMARSPGRFQSKLCSFYHSFHSDSRTINITIISCNHTFLAMTYLSSSAKINLPYVATYSYVSGFPMRE